MKKRAVKRAVYVRDEIHSKMLMNLEHGEEAKKSGIKGKKRVE
ncbi:hypothetical protein ACXHJ2_23915 [Paenibacillus sp. ALE3]|nr:MULTISPECIES: hypothetical protein [unclassified Paenibacillus]MEE4568191.1 hypothetical protein [Paenibacillus polymyxa]